MIKKVNKIVAVISLGFDKSAFRINIIAYFPLFPLYSSQNANSYCKSGSLWIPVIISFIPIASLLYVLVLHKSVPQCPKHVVYNLDLEIWLANLLSECLHFTRIRWPNKLYMGTYFNTLKFNQRQLYCWKSKNGVPRYPPFISYQS